MTDQNTYSFIVKWGRYSDDGKTRVQCLDGTKEIVASSSQEAVRMATRLIGFEPKWMCAYHKTYEV